MFPGITSIRLCERVLKDKIIIKQWDFAGYWPRPILICAFLVLEGLANQYSANPWSHTCPQHLMYYIEICIQRRVATTPLCPSWNDWVRSRFKQFYVQFPYGLQTSIVTEKLENCSKSLLTTLFSLWLKKTTNNRSAIQMQHIESTGYCFIVFFISV